MLKSIALEKYMEIVINNIFKSNRLQKCVLALDLNLFAALLS